MSWRIIEISEDGRYLHADRQVLVISAERAELGRVPLADIQSIIIHARHASYSHGLLLKLADYGIPLVLCNERHDPTSLLLPVESHHLSGGRASLQAAAKKPLEKRLWRDLVRVKIREQAESLLCHDPDAAQSLRRLSARVRSGDPENIEARAARIYWKRLFGAGFKRDRTAQGLNAHLNYGYAIVRSAMARTVVGSGLSPALGIGHVNARNPFALIDDLIEPFRPLVDRVVKEHADHWTGDVRLEAKTSLAAIMGQSIATRKGDLSVLQVMSVCVTSYVHTLENGQGTFDLPKPIAVTKSSSLFSSADAQ